MWAWAFHQATSINEGVCWHPPRRCRGVVLFTVFGPDAQFSRSETRPANTARPIHPSFRLYCPINRADKGFAF